MQMQPPPSQPQQQPFGSQSSMLPNGQPSVRNYQNPILSQSHQQLPPQPHIQPQQSMSHQNLGQQNMPTQNVPQQNMGPPNLPQQNMAPQNPPQQNFPQQNLPQQNNPQQNMSQQNLPHQNISQQNMPHQNGEQSSSQQLPNIASLNLGPSTSQNESFSTHAPLNKLPNGPSGNNPFNPNAVRYPPVSYSQSQPQLQGPINSNIYAPQMPPQQPNSNNYAPQMPPQPNMNNFAPQIPPQQNPNMYGPQGQNLPLVPNVPSARSGTFSNGPKYPSYPQQMPPMPMQGNAPMPPGQNYPQQPMGMGQQNYPQQPQVQAGYGGQQQPGSQARKLDPEQMPSPISVMLEDSQSRSGVFQTNQRGLLPPLVTTKYRVEDLGNSSPRFIRSTLYSVPTQPDMLKQTAVPFAIVINPLASPGEGEENLSCVDLGPLGPVRCIRCKAYMSPLMVFIDGGRRFQCLLCKATTDTPPEYFQHLDHTGQRVDKWERPELWRGSYEFMATTEYCRNNTLPKEPGYVFAIDVTYNNIKSGLVNLICGNISTLLESLPPHTPVGFITYNSKVHFYNIDPKLSAPQMVVVPDISDMFMPILDGFFVPRSEASASIEALMAQIPLMFADTKETEGVLGPAVQAAMEALKASDRVGKVLLLHSSLPTSEHCPGKLKNREGDRRLLGTDKEKVVLTPQSTYYNNLAQECVGAGVSVDLYLFNNSYIDVATIGQLARVTGGSVNKYTFFQADVDGGRVVGEMRLHLSRSTAFDSVMRVRTSTGVRPIEFYGHFYMGNTTDVEIAAIDSTKSLAVEIKHDDKLTDDEGVYIQVALLYTSIYGQRRLRLLNLALNTCLQMADLYRNCELDTIVNFLAKQSISKSIDSTPQTIKDGIIQRSAQMLATYRKHCANPSMPGQLILPECLKLLPLYASCILRSDGVGGGPDLTPDDRSWTMYAVMTMGVESSVHHFYPQLFPIGGGEGGSGGIVPIRCTAEKMREDSAYILENGIYLFLWIGSKMSGEWLESVFGVSNLNLLNVETISELPDHVNSDESLRLRALLRQLRTTRNRHMRLTVIRQGDKIEIVMKKFLVEDRSSDGHASYVDFLCHMHKEIRALLNQ